MAEPHSPPQRQAGATTSVLDRQLSITGAVTSQGAVRIEGTVDGEIEARTVTLAESATVKGAIVADAALIEGRLVGPLHAREARLTGTARVEGEIVHTLLVVEPGAHFTGRSRRASQAPDAAPPEGAASG